MSTPQGSGGRTFTLIPNRVPTLLADNVNPAAPLTIYNSGTVGVYLAGDTISGPSSSLPLGPGLAMTWTTAGTVYASADPTSSANATIVTTSAIGGWPAPAPPALSPMDSWALASWVTPIPTGGVPLTHVGAACAFGSVTALVSGDYASCPAGWTLDVSLIFDSLPALGKVALLQTTMTVNNPTHFSGKSAVAIPRLPYQVAIATTLGGSIFTLSNIAVTLVPVS